MQPTGVIPRSEEKYLWTRTANRCSKEVEELVYLHPVHGKLKRGCFIMPISINKQLIIRKRRINMNVLIKQMAVDLLLTFWSFRQCIHAMECVLLNPLSCSLKGGVVTQKELWLVLLITEAFFPNHPLRYCNKGSHKCCLWNKWLDVVEAVTNRAATQLELVASYITITLLFGKLWLIR